MSKRWWLYITLSIFIFVAITCAIFFYWNIGDENKWSTFFSFTSTFGILATINVYFWQKKDLNKNKIDEAENIASMAIDLLRENLLEIKSKLEENIHTFKTLEDNGIHLLSMKNEGNVVYLFETMFYNKSSSKTCRLIHKNIKIIPNEYIQLMYSSGKYNNLIIEIQNLAFAINKCNITNGKIPFLSTDSQDDKEMFYTDISISINHNRDAENKVNEIINLIYHTPC